MNNNIRFVENICSHHSFVFLDCEFSGKHVSTCSPQSDSYWFMKAKMLTILWELAWIWIRKERLLRLLKFRNIYIQYSVYICLVSLCSKSFSFSRMFMYDYNILISFALGCSNIFSWYIGLFRYIYLELSCNT
jgi:hypothetical protein